MVDKHIGGLYVQMKHAVCMGKGECLTQRVGNGRGLVKGERVAVHAMQKLGQRHTVDILHDQVGIGGVVRKVDNLHDIGMLKHGGGMRLAQHVHDVAGGHAGAVDKGDALNGHATRQISMEPKPPVASVSSGWYRLSSSRELVPSKGTSGENRAVCCEKSGMANPRAFKVRLRAAGAGPSRSRWHRCC